MLCWPSFPPAAGGVKACSCYLPAFFALLRVGSSSPGFSWFHAFLTASLERLLPQPFDICRVFPLSDAWRLSLLDWSWPFSLETNFVTLLAAFRVALTTLLRSTFAPSVWSTFCGPPTAFSLSAALRTCLVSPWWGFYSPSLAFLSRSLPVWAQLLRYNWSGLKAFLSIILTSASRDLLREEQVCRR